MATSGGDGTSESATKSCNVSIKPKQPENFTVTAVGREVTLSWDPIEGINYWKYTTNNGNNWRWHNELTTGATPAVTAGTHRCQVRAGMAPAPFRHHQ